MIIILTPSVFTSALENLEIKRLSTAPFKPRLIAQKNSSGGLFWVTMRLDKKFTTLWVKKITPNFLLKMKVQIFYGKKTLHLDLRTDKALLALYSIITVM